MPTPTLELIDKHLTYNFFQGKFISNSSGMSAGSKRPDGYIKISIDGVNYLEHRLAWQYAFGYIPNDEIDHKDRIKHHNHIDNLREATRSENLQNRMTPKKNNKTGYLGVSFTKEGTYRATLGINNVQKYLGTFSTAEKAYEAYLKAKEKYHPFSDQTLDEIRAGKPVFNSTLCGE